MLSRMYCNCSKTPLRKSIFNFFISGHKETPITSIQLRSIQTSCSNMSLYGEKSSAKNLLNLGPQYVHKNTPQYMAHYSSDAQPELSNKDKLKRAVKEYGATVIVFHVSISLLSLGICYLAISGGLNVNGMLEQVGLHGSSEIAAETGVFIVAYAVHKVMAPFRIGVTLVAAPLIVRYLRKKNILKPPKATEQNQISPK